MSLFDKISASPTNPSKSTRKKSFDIEDLFDGPIEKETTSTDSSTLDEKLRQAYFWITNNAIISPYYDIEYHEGNSLSYYFGDAKSLLTLPSGQSYSSFILMPLLNLMVQRRCLLVGGPGRGKTASAILMGIISGYSLQEIRRGIQHGQPQMTITDLLGNPLPKDLVGADSMDEIRIAWRKWLGMRVKIIDEYNRIPTRTQSALLTLMADNYAEVLDQVFECPDAAWYLTANDDAGGGTYQVIEALRDRIDIVVKALHFSPRFLGDLLGRIEAGIKPEEYVPNEIIFSEEELDSMRKEIRLIHFPYALQRRLEFFASQFEFMENAGAQFEYKTKDTLKLSGLDYALINSKQTGIDKTKVLGDQTKNGLSVRALMTAIIFIKAMAYFRGANEISLEDMRQMIPFVMHDKFVPNHDSPFFEQPGYDIYRVDRIGWIRKIFDLSCQEYDRLNLDKEDPLRFISDAFNSGLEGVSLSEIDNRLAQIEKILKDWSKNRKLYGHLFDDILKLKYYHQRYTNYKRWLKSR